MAQHSIEIILLRQWASFMAMPIWISGAQGELLYYNESAEALLGRGFEEAQEMPVEELSELFHTSSVEGDRIAPEELPIGIVFRDKEPAHRRVQIKGLDGITRLLDITAFPLKAVEGRYLGAVAVFWEVKAS